MGTPAAFKRWIDKAAETYEGDVAALDGLVDRTIRAKGATDELVFSFAQVRLLERIAAALEALVANGKGARR